MGDNRREERRRKILENSEKRLEKLKMLKRSNHEVLTENFEETRQDSEYEHKEFDSEILTKSNENITTEDERDTRINKNERNEGCLDDEKVTLKKDEVKEIRSTDPEKPTWFVKNYRVILFALLAWVVYLVVVKDFDFILAYLIGRKLPKDVLPNLFTTAFVAVELQVLLLELFVKKATPQSASIYLFVLKFTGIPEKLIHRVQQLIGYLLNALTDLCVYLFVIVLLHVIDTKLR